MELTHRDTGGNVWRFGIDCTPKQAEIIRATLAAVRTMNTRHTLSISAMIDAEHDAPLFAAIEKAILRGLADAFPAPPQPKEQPTEQENPGGYWYDDI